MSRHLNCNFTQKHTKFEAMTSARSQQFFISMPTALATQADQACRVEERNSSDFVCEAVGHNLAARLEIKPSVLSAYVATESIDEDPFRLLAQWRDEADAIYDVLRY